MPIENFFNAVKMRLVVHRHAVLASNLAPQLLRPIFESVATPEICQSFFRGCGYYDV